MNRRNLLKVGGLAGAALIVPAIAAQLIREPGASGGPDRLFADFAKDDYSAGGFAAAFQFTRASPKTDLLPSSPLGATYTIFKPDMPAIVPGKGILIEEARAQLLASPDKPVSQSATLASPGTYTLWVNGRGQATISAGTAVLAGAGTASLGVPLVFRVIAAGTVKIAVTGALLAFQLEKGSSGTSFIPAKGRRIADNLVPIGPLAAILGGDNGAVLVDAQSTGATDPYASLVRIGANALGMDFCDGGIFSTDDASGHPQTAALGIGRFRDGAKALLAWTPAHRSLVAGGGPVNRGSPLKAGGATSFAIGLNGKDYWNGYIRRLDAFGQGLPDADLRALTAGAKPQIVVMGDSLTARNDGGPEGLSFPARLGALLGKTVLNGGVGGESSTQIAKRYASAPELWRLPLVVWAGRNNFMQVEQVKTDIADMVSRNSSGKILVLSVINGQLVGEESGGKSYAPRVALNQALAKTYRAGFVDVQAALVGAYDPLNPVDVLDHSVDRVPYSLRSVNEAGVRFYLPDAIDAEQTAFEASGAARSKFVMKVEQEYILIEQSKGGRIDSADRGYGTGGVAAPHPANSAYLRSDPVHLNDKGRAVVARAVAAKIKALGW